jgi:hypothetical protein
MQSLIAVAFRLVASVGMRCQAAQGLQSLTWQSPLDARDEIVRDKADQSEYAKIDARRHP